MGIYCLFYIKEDPLGDILSLYFTIYSPPPNGGDAD